jgi:hypothetical protein
MTAESIARGLDLKRTGRTWRGPCPLHGGTSFTVTERDGVPLWTCWSGCDRAAILSELRRRGLWPEKERRAFTAEEKREYGRRRLRARTMARAAGRWLTERLVDLDEEKRAATTDGFDVFTLQAAASEHYRLSRLDEAGVLREWLAARAAEPEGTREIELRGERWGRACRRLVYLILNQQQTEGARDAA